MNTPRIWLLTVPNLTESFQNLDLNSQKKNLIKKAV